MSSCSAENQVKASNYVEKYLIDFMDAFGLNERVSQQDDMFIEALRRYPPDTNGAHYAELWDTLNSLEVQNLPTDHLCMFIESAMLSFSERFVSTNRRDFAAELTDYVIGLCIMRGICETFNNAMDKISILQDNASSEQKAKSGDSSDEEK